MKQTYSFLLFIFSFTICRAQYVTLPDNNFVNWLGKNGFATCMKGNQLDTTCPAVLGCKKVICEYEDLHDLNGIQYFKNLDTLICSSNFLTGMPPIAASITRLECSVNNLGSLPVLPPSIVYLNCENNQLTDLPLLPAHLSIMDCSYNNITSLPDLPPSLNRLLCYHNQLTYLPFLPDSLRDLESEDNKLTTLPALPDSMLELAVSTNPDLTCLPEIKKIHFFYFGQTAVKCVPNRGQVYYSDPPIDSIQLCSNHNPDNCSLNSIESVYAPAGRVNIFPNPTTGSFTISTSEEISNGLVEIFNVMGEKVQSTKYQDTRRIAIDSHLVPGIYFVRVGERQKQLNAKLVIQ